jgi:hypothetical protein
LQFTALRRANVVLSSNDAYERKTMSIEGPSIVVVTDDQPFADCLTELFLRGGVRSIRFAQLQTIADDLGQWRPDLIVLQVPSARWAEAWAEYQALQARLAAAGIPVLLYAPAPTDQAGLKAGLSVSTLMGPVWPATSAADGRAGSSHGLPTGHNDLYSSLQID